MKRHIVLVTTVGVLIVILLWYTFLFKPESHNLSNLQDKASTLQSKQSGLEARLSSLKHAQTQQPQREATLAQYEAAIPATADLADFINQINGLAASSGVKLQSLAPGLPTAPATTSGGNNSTSSSVSTIVVTAQTSGDYSSTLAFLDGLYMLPRLVVVNGLTVGGSGGGTSAGTTSPAQSPTASPTNNGNSLQTTFKMTIFTTAAPVSPTGAPAK